MNMGLLNKVVIFAVGAAVGSAVTYVVTRRKYEQSWEYEEEETQEIQETEEENSDDGNDEEEPKKDDVVQYNKIVKNYSSEDIKEEKEEDLAMDIEKPYEITVDEYGEMDDYEVNSLYYYEDKVLTDQYGNVIDDVNEIVGEENLKKFDDETVDCIYIRNDALMSDYEVLRDIGFFYPVKR